MKCEKQSAKSGGQVQKNVYILGLHFQEQERQESWIVPIERTK